MSTVRVHPSLFAQERKKTRAIVPYYTKLRTLLPPSRSPDIWLYLAA